MSYVTNNGVRIHYETVGSGPPIIFSHGGNCNSTMWKLGGYVDGLKEYRRILVDRRGCGLSEKPRAPTGYSMEEQVSDIVAVLDALRLRRATFWGFSAGGAVGFAMVARHPDRVAAFIAAGADSKPYTEKSAKDLRDLGAEKFLRGFNDSEEGVTLPQWLKVMPERDFEVFKSDFETHISECSEWVKWGGEWDALPRIQTPTLIICGSKEDPDRESEEEAKRLQNGRAVFLEGLGHVGAFLRSDLSIPIVRKFLKEAGIEPESSPRERP
jgi:pimeloyl-ACP methyl ester carboxylesterase